MKIKTIICILAGLGVGSASADEASPIPIPVYRMPSVTAAGPNAAQSNSNSYAVASTSSAGGAAQGVGSQGQSLSIDSHAVYEAQSRNPVSTAIAPPLTSSNDTCMGSTSVGASAVSFGVSVGSTWTDDNCVMLKNAREMWNMGFKGAALARLCMDESNKEALEATGINCPARKSAKASEASRARAQEGNAANDPYRY